MPDLITAFGLIALVLVLSALGSGLVERAPLSFPMLFLGIGFALGPQGANLLRLDSHDPTLEVVATLSLALVLFLDAVKLEFGDGRSQWVVPALVLGPGTLITIALIASGGLVLLGLGLVPALLLGAVLASTDPVVLRDVVRDPRIPRPVRRVLSIEAGTNDIVVLPIVLVLIAYAAGRASGMGDWLALLAKLFLLSPAVGLAVGAMGSELVGWVDRRMSIRREYQALYGLGLVFAAFASAQALGGDGFLAAFSAGAAVAALNNTLCDCFLEYGETTAEMAMLLAFILFGALLSARFVADPGLVLLSLLLGVFAIGMARPVALTLVLRGAALSREARGIIAWFGPRGLNSLLLTLLVVLANVPDAERLLTIAGVVVTLSVIVHGASATPLASWYARRVAVETLPEERRSDAAGLFQQGESDEVSRIEPAQLAELLASETPPILLDVRSRSQYEQDRVQIPGSVRVLPDHIAAWANGRDHTRAVIAYCT